MAGLICIYDTQNFYYLNVTWDEELGRCLDVTSCLKGNYGFLLQDRIPISNEGAIYLKADIDYDKLRFYFSEDGKKWNCIGEIFDASTLSDEFDEGGGDAHFTGAFVGLCCQDLSGLKIPADFDYFEYREK
jgi:xylan 1,4-beta-xylosidase